LTGNIIGERFVIVSFGESHGKAVGTVVDGCPAGLPIEEEDIQKELNLRRPGVTSLDTPRLELDRAEILSGVFNGYTTGAPICIIVKNQDVMSNPYESIKNLPRPSHADYVSRIKYGSFNDYRGGGRFSARRTIAHVIGGAIAKKLLLLILKTKVIAYTVEVGGIKAKDILMFDEANIHRYDNDIRCPDGIAAKKMITKIQNAKSKGDSVGGVIQCIAINVPIGLGEPCFSSLDSDLAKFMLSIPAAKGIEFGSGFKGSKNLGSVNNDEYIINNKKLTTSTNNSGGIQGGLSNGMPIVLRVAFKPVSSIGKKQKTVDLSTMRETKISVPGRHDPCVIPRAVPIVESTMATVLVDHAIRAHLIPPIIKSV
jgi:chorismate synthase